jgi:hypothetical protein
MLKAYSEITCFSPHDWPVQWCANQEDCQDSIFYLILTSCDLILYYKKKPYFSARDCYSTVQRNQHGFVLKALERRDKKPSIVLDPTAGWGREAITLALSGVSVVAIEQSAIPVTFLKYALHFLFPQASIVIHHENFLNFAKRNVETFYPAIYLDPLFFENKTSLSKKAMELLYNLPEVSEINQAEHDLYLKEGLCLLKTDTLVIKQYKQSPSWLKANIMRSQKMTKTCRYDIYYLNQKMLNANDFEEQ